MAYSDNLYWQPPPTATPSINDYYNPTPVGGGTPDPQAGQAANPAKDPATNSPYDYTWAKGQVSAAYKKYLGRDAAESDYSAWVNPSGPTGYQFTTPNWEQGISGSDEAKKYAAAQAAGPAPAGVSGGAGPQNGDYQSWFTQLVSGKPPTPDSLLSLKDELKKYGIEVMTNAAGVAGKIKLPNGQIVDVITAAGAGGTGWQWMTGAGGGGGAAGGPPQVAPNYGPMIMPNGLPPPGLPYQPSAEMTGMQDNVLKNILSNPTLSPEYTSRLNEQQKELALGREAGATRSAAQNAASRGVARGGAQQATQRRLHNLTTQDLLQSQRDVANTSETTNRQGFLNALGASEGVLGGRADRSLQLQKFLELIREYGLDDAYRYATANQNAEQFWASRLFQ